MTKGKIVNKETGLEVPGTLERKDTDGDMRFRIEGSYYHNLFRAREWDFIADPSGLPTDPGLYKMQKTDEFQINHNLLLLSQSGKWYFLGGRPHGCLYETEEETVKRYAKTMTKVNV